MGTTGGEDSFSMLLDYYRGRDCDMLALPYNRVQDLDEAGRGRGRIGDELPSWCVAEFILNALAAPRSLNGSHSVESIDGDRERGDHT